MTRNVTDHSSAPDAFENIAPHTCEMTELTGGVGPPVNATKPKTGPSRTTPPPVLPVAPLPISIPTEAPVEVVG
jgi:hypothetical protein